METSLNTLRTFRRRLLWTLVIQWIVVPLGAVLNLLAFSGWSSSQVLELLANFLTWAAIPIALLFAKPTRNRLQAIEEGLGLTSEPTEAAVRKSWQTLRHLPRDYFVSLIVFMAIGITGAFLPLWLFSWFTTGDIVKITLIVFSFVFFLSLCGVSVLDRVLAPAIDRVDSVAAARHLALPELGLTITARTLLGVFGTAVSVVLMTVAASYSFLEGALSPEVRATILGPFVGRMTLLVITVMSVGLFSALLSARALASPLQMASKRLGEMATGQGDLTQRLAVLNQNEIGDLSRRFNTFVATLQTIIQQAGTTADSVAGATAQFASTVQRLASGAQQQAAALEETAANMEEMTATVKQSATNAVHANQLAEDSRTMAVTGHQDMTAAVASMEELTQASRQIGEFTTMIDEIAFQTNLLALNAAVEAARAGEQGRGFAVVAAEVRNLAQRSATAAKQVKGVIQDATQKRTASAEQTARSGNSLQRIVTHAKQVSTIVAEMATASQEQARGIEQVNRAIAQMDQVTQNNVAEAEELSATVQLLNGQAQQLRTLIGSFKVHQHTRGSTPSFAIGTAPERYRPEPLTAHLST
ncbi:MAG: HAMP domain-containing protein [Deltaproteobacteria bacterium]|nr:HAMP domain-containing protein [Deltaproteobacteria bacterium]